MYRITGQAINLRYIATSIKQDIELSEQSLHIIKVAEFGVKHGYTVAIEAFNVRSLLIIIIVNFICTIKNMV
jgi:hypothetical protein